MKLHRAMFFSENIFGRGIRMKFLSSALIILFAVSCGNKSAVSSKDVIASIVFMLGDVSVEKKGSSIKASLNSIVDKGSVIKTLKGSQCNILIQPDSYILVKENSSFSIESLTQNSDGTSNSSVELKVGKIAVNPGKLLKGSDFRVKTPTAVAAVRGTKFTVSTDDGKGIKISVIEGKVELKPRAEQLEKADTPEAVRKAVTAKLNEQAVIIEEKQTGEISTVSSDKMTAEVSAVVAEYKTAESLPDDKKNSAQDKALGKVNAAVIPASPVKTEVLSVESVSDVESLSKMIEDNRKTTKSDLDTSGIINIINPVNEADVLIDGKKAGRGSLSVKIAAGVKTKIEIRAKKYEPYYTDVMLAVGEEKVIQPELVKTALLDRIEWSEYTGNIKGDISIADGVIISAASSGTVSAMRGNGIKVWSVSIGTAISSSPMIGNNSVYIIGADENLYSVNLASGKIQWKIKTGGTLTFGSAPCVAKDTVVTALSNGLIKGFSKDGKELWAQNIRAGIYSSPASSGDTVYVGADDQILYSIDAGDGSINWKGRLDGRVVSSSPLIFDNAVIIGTYKGTLTALNVKNGKSLWVFKTKGPIVSTPVADNGTVYFGSRDKNVYAVKRSDGSLVWSYLTSFPVTADVSIAGGIIYVLSGKTVYAFDMQDKKLQWTFDSPSAASSVQSAEGRVYLGGSSGLFGLRTDLRDIIRR